MSEDNKKPTVAELASIAAQILPHVDDVSLAATRALEIWKACEQLLTPLDHETNAIMDEFLDLKRDREDRISLDSFIRCAGATSDSRLNRFKIFVKALIRHERIKPKHASEAIRLSQEERDAIVITDEEVEERMTQYRNGLPKDAAELWFYWRAWLQIHHARPCSVKILQDFAFQS